MDMKQLFSERRLLAIMRNVPLEQTLDYADTIVAGGVTLFEVALNSKDGLRQIELLRARFDGRAVIGAGTAITLERAQAALTAGAQFLLTPSVPEDVLGFCQAHGVPMLPGVFTPTDVATCLRYGFSTLKLFPAGDMPMRYVKSLKGPFDETNYVAIGGVTPENARAFLDAGYIAAGIGSNLFSREVIEARDWSRGTEQIAAMVRSVQP